MQIQPTTITDRDLWNATLAQLPYAHILQTWEWGEFKKSTTGWMPQRLAFMHKGGVVAEGTPAEIMAKSQQHSLEDVFIRIARSGDIEE